MERNLSTIQGTPTTPLPQASREERLRAARERDARAAGFSLTEWATIPRIDPVTGCAFGEVNKHTVAVAPAIGVYRCDCQDWEYRRHLHNGRCKHVAAVVKRALLEAMDEED